MEVLILVQNTYYFLQSYDYDGENVKLDGKLCAYLKRGIGFKARGFDCTDPMDYYCLWTRKYLILLIKFRKSYYYHTTIASNFAEQLIAISCNITSNLI